MSWDWHDRDLVEWSQKTLPEFLLVSMQDPNDKKKVVARTPWECFELTVSEVHVSGDANLTGKRSQALFVFDLDIGLRVDIHKESRGPQRDDGVEVRDYWPCLVDIQHFEDKTMKPVVEIRFQDVEDHVSDEVGWYLREGMGRRYLWHSLARWHAYAVKKWCGCEAPEIEDPYASPEIPPIFPPFREEERRRHEAKLRGGTPSSGRALKAPSNWEALEEGESVLARGLAADIKRNEAAKDKSADAGASVEPPQFYTASSPGPLIGLKKVAFEEENPWVSPVVSDDEDDHESDGEWELDEVTMEFKRKEAPLNTKKFSRYPFLPSMMMGVGGPATDWLRPKEHAIGRPEWTNKISTREPGKITSMDMVLDKARKQRENTQQLASGKQSTLNAIELCVAIEKGDIMKAFAKLDDETVNCPHPESGRCAVHYCVQNGTKELLEMVIEAKANVNRKDSRGQTALMLAARKHYHDLTRLLLDAGADATEEDDWGRSASEMVKVAPIEPDGPLKNWREKMSGNPIPEDTAKKAHELKQLIEEKEKPKKYGSILITAIAGKDVRTAESAIDTGADVNAVDERGDPPLILITKGKWKGQEGVQARLVDKVRKAGADVNLQNKQGNTALLYASHRGNFGLVEKLLSFKANVSLANSEGNTPLMYAAHGGFESMCTLLLEHFAEPATKNSFGLTAEAMAQQRGFRSCAVIIQAYEMAPKVEDAEARRDEPRRREKKAVAQGFDYSKWNALEKEMAKDEEQEEHVREREAKEASNRKAPMTMEEMGPESFGLPNDTPWPPPDPGENRKGPFDYSRWDKIVHDVNRENFAMDRYEHLQRHPQYEWRNGEKMQIIF